VQRRIDTSNRPVTMPVADRSSRLIADTSGIIIDYIGSAPARASAPPRTKPLRIQSAADLPPTRPLPPGRASTLMCRMPPHQKARHSERSEEPRSRERRGRESIWRGTRQLTAPNGTEQPGHITERSREPRKGNWPEIRPTGHPGHRNSRSPQTGEFPARHQVKSVIPSRDLSTAKGACRGISALP
jgi:hypothetical protein